MTRPVCQRGPDRRCVPADTFRGRVACALWPSVADVFLPFQEHEALRYNARIAAIKANLLMSEVRKDGRLFVALYARS